MPDEQDFLKAIQADPQDRGTRLVYADWLEERGNARAELVRVEEEMRRVPIYSDRYWELKPRRNALRRKCKKDWLAQLRYGTDYEPVFREVPDGWKERWRLLREFTERWYGIPMADVGGQVRRVAEAEHAVKRHLPPSVREWIAYRFDLRNSFVDVLRDCYEFKELTDLDALSLMIQGESDRYWAVRKEQLREPDPPVQWYGLNWEDDNRFVHDGEFAPHVTSFVFRHLMVLLHGQGGGRDQTVTSPARWLRQLTAAFPACSEFDGTHIFEQDNLLVLFGPEPYAHERPVLRLHLWKQLPRAEVPKCLQKLLPARA